MVRESRVVDFEPEVVEVVCDQDRVRLLFVDTEGESLDSSEEEERVERREGVPDRVDRELNALHEGKRQRRVPLDSDVSLELDVLWQSRHGHSR